MKLENSNCKTIGVLGGLGPAAAAKCYMDLVQKLLRIDPKRLPSILSWNIPISLELDQYLMERELLQKKKEIFIELLKDGIHRLVNGGADIIIMPCNTAHLYMDFIETAEGKSLLKGIPFVSIIQETVRSLYRDSFNEKVVVGILGTDRTTQSGLYTKSLKANGISFIVPTENDQQIVMSSIAAVLDSTADDQTKQSLKNVVKNLTEAGATHILLGCTELPLLISETQNNCKFVNPIDVLENAIINDIYELNN